MRLPDDVILRVSACPATGPAPPAPLTDDERARLATFGSEKRRMAFVLGRATVRELLAERLGVVATSVPLMVATDGALEIGGGLRVSLAHTATEREAVAAAVAGSRPVGVDVEALRPRRPDLYRFLLHPDEYGLLDALPHEPEVGQVVLWAVKEAVLKAQRTGFRCSPKQLRVELADGGHHAVVRVESGEVWEVRIAERHGCAVAVAFKEPRE
jgi:4'-phosphopantetheinyl transferase